MEFIQSRFQNVFSRLYEMACEMFWYMLIAIVFSLFFSFEINFLPYFVLSLIFTTCSVCYFASIHKDAAKVIRINDEKFIFLDYKTKTVINWEDFQGYKISRTIPYKVIIKSRVYGSKTRFSYYAFSSKQRKQRKQIFEILQRKSANKSLR